MPAAELDAAAEDSAVTEAEADADAVSAVVPPDEQAASSDAVMMTGTTSKDLRIADFPSSWSWCERAERMRAGEQGADLREAGW